MSIAYVAMFLMNIIDVLYTQNALASGGDEANPLMKYVLNIWGLSGIAYVKIVFLAIFLGFIGIISRDTFLRRFFYGATGVYACLTAYHVLLYYGIVGPAVL